MYDKNEKEKCEHIVKSVISHKNDKSIIPPSAEDIAHSLIYHYNADVSGGDYVDFCKNVYGISMCCHVIDDAIDHIPERMRRTLSQIIFLGLMKRKSLNQIIYTIGNMLHILRNGIPSHLIHSPLTFYMGVKSIDAFHKFSLGTIEPLTPRSRRAFVVRDGDDKQLWVHPGYKNYRIAWLKCFGSIPTGFDVDHIFAETGAEKFGYKLVRLALVKSSVNRHHGPSYEKIIRKDLPDIPPVAYASGYQLHKLIGNVDLPDLNRTSYLDDSARYSFGGQFTLLQQKMLLRALGLTTLLNNPKYNLRKKI